MGVDLKPFIKDAQELEKKTGIPASITLGQIALESAGKFSGGLSALAANAKNLFGVKGVGNNGSVLMPTTEVYNDIPRTVQASFKKYRSYLDSMLDYAKVLSLPRYQTHLKDAKTIQEFAKGIQAGGYATDPAYADKILQVIKDNNLTKYDSGKINFAGAGDGKPDSPAKPAEKNNTVEVIFSQTTRFILVILLVVLMFIFFFKAFPAVADTAENVASITPVGRVGKMTKGIKRGKK